MRLRQLDEIKYEESSSDLTMSGLDSSERRRRVNISIKDPEKFLNAIKSALRSTNGESFRPEMLDGTLERRPAVITEGFPSAPKVRHCMGRDR